MIECSFCQMKFAAKIHILSDSPKKLGKKFFGGCIKRCSLGVGRAHVFRLPFFHDFPAEDAFIPETVDVILALTGQMPLQTVL